MLSAPMLVASAYYVDLPSFPCWRNLTQPPLLERSAGHCDCPPKSRLHATGCTTCLGSTVICSPMPRVPVKILPNVERSEALRLLDQEGTLLVLCSLVDNMPYVLAEAAVGTQTLSDCALQRAALLRLHTCAVCVYPHMHTVLLSCQ